MGEYTLWGTPHSLYTGKTRSYLIKKRLPYSERFPSDPDFAGKVLPKVGHFVVPVIETPDGELVQDTSAIFDALEVSHSEPVLQPAGPVQRVVAALLDAFGSNYLLPLAMHYRWSYQADQDLFLKAEFARALPAMPHHNRLEAAGNLMTYFAGFLPNLGVADAVIPAMEQSYHELLAVLETHFQLHPYLLGGRPSIADFGMMAPLFAHLGRDPVPASLMKKTAPSVFRWTERMNSPAIADADYLGYPETYPEADAIPGTLEPVLRLIFADWTPGLSADFAQFEAWLKDQPDPDSGILVSRDGGRSVHPSTGPINYPWRGIVMQRQSAPHSLWHFARVQAEVQRADAAASQRLTNLLERTGGAEMFALTTSRVIGRSGGVLVLT